VTVKCAWQFSNWDNQTHAFMAVPTEGFAEAKCQHSVPPSELRDPEAGDHPCPSCQLMIGDMIADATEATVHERVSLPLAN
jgi:hypothetical protein